MKHSQMHPRALLAGSLLKAAQAAADEHLPTARDLANDAAVMLNRLAHHVGYQPAPELVAKARRIIGIPAACGCCGGEVGTVFTTYDYLPSRLCAACAEDAADIREQALAWREAEAYWRNASIRWADPKQSGPRVVAQPKDQT